MCDAHAPASPRWPLFLLGTLFLACLLLPISSGAALGLGLAFSWTTGGACADLRRRWVSRLLAVAVVGLGGGQDLFRVLHHGMRGIGWTALTLVLVLLMAWGLLRLLKVQWRMGLLVGIGTAVCGGSAIAAAAPALEAEEGETTLALGTVFLLNAVGLWVFPPLGRWAGLDGPTFGLWAALGIHDTSSVVGAALAYGQGALDVAVTTKLARALWIVPLTLALGAFLKSSNRPAKRPWFILGFLGMAALAGLGPGFATVGGGVASGARRLMVATLLLVGAGLDRQTLLRTGWRPLVMGILLWVLLGAGSLWAVSTGLLRP